MLQASTIQDIAKTIIQHQQVIIGPLALEQALKIPGIYSEGKGDIKIELTNNNGNNILSALVKQYESLFGQASIEACKDAVKELKTSVSTAELPEILR